VAGFVLGVVLALWMNRAAWNELDDSMRYTSSMLASPAMYQRERDVYLQVTYGPTYGDFGRLVEPQGVSRALRTLDEGGA
jgi:hypothetical protein